MPSFLDRIKSALAGAGAGAAGGALGGSFLPGLGTLAGGAIGGLAGLGRGLASGTAHESVGNVLGGIPQATGQALQGTPASIEQYSNLTPQQQQAQMMALMQALQGLSQNPGDFAPIEDQARQQFAQQTIPSIAERFTALGGGAQSSGAFRDALGQAGAGLETNLAALKSSHGLQQRQLLQSLLGLGLNPSIETVRNAPQPGLFQSGIQGLAQNLPLLALLRNVGGQGQGGNTLGVQGQSQLPGVK